MVRVDFRTRAFDAPPQDVISRNNVSVRVTAILYYRVIEPEKSIIRVEDYNQATSELAQTTLHSASISSSSCCPTTEQLRYLGTLSNIAGEKSSTIVFPIPMDLIQRLANKIQ